VTGSDLVAAIQAYFAGERATGLLLAAALGPLFLAAAVWLWRHESGGFATALLVPSLVLGLAGTVGGGVLAWQSGQRIESLSAGATTDASATARGEVARMERVNANWPRLKLAWALMAAVGFGLALAGARPWMHGLGVALIVMAALALTVDVFAERRAEVYTRALAGSSAGWTEGPT
jgi:hypothetical protein